MTDFFHANPLVVRYVKDNERVFTRELGYAVTDKKGTPLGHAHEDLGDSGPMRLLNDFGRDMAGTRTVVLDDPGGRPLLSLYEERYRSKSRTRVMLRGAEILGTITRKYSSGLSRRYVVHDANRRRLATITTGPKSGFDLSMVHTPGKTKKRLARIDRTRQRDATLTEIPTYTLRIRTRRVGEPLGMLLRAAPLVVDFAEFRGDD